MDIKIETLPPAPPPPRQVVMTISEDEARVIRRALYIASVAWKNPNVDLVSKFTDPIWLPLDRAKELYDYMANANVGL